MTLNEIIEDLENTIKYFENPKTQVQVGRVYQAEKTLKQLRTHDVVGQNEKLECGNNNPPCSPNIKFGYLECTRCSWGE